MKIKNISNQTLSIPFKSKIGKGIVVNINPGQIVFCEPHTKDNKQVVVYLRKKKIEISEDDKPTNGQYYHPYGIISHEEAVKLTQHTAHTLDLDDEDDEEETVEITSNESLSKDLEEIKESDLEEEVEVVDSETPTKNKGGRPRGSKNKKKPGRPKKKKSVGKSSKNRSTESSAEEKQ